MALTTPTVSRRAVERWSQGVTVGGPATDMPVAAVIPGVASLGVRDLVTGPVRTARVLGAARHAAWLEVGERVLVIGGPDAVRLPNSISVGANPKVSSYVSVGAGRVVLGALTIEAVRWWDPVPVLRRTGHRALDPTVRSAARGLGRFRSGALAEPLTRRDADGVLDAAAGLLGRGSGLTPEGDDLLAAALASFVLVADALGDDSAGATVLAVADRLLVAAAARTTALSASLLRHAVVGAVADPVADLLRALTGRGDVPAALGRLRSVGHSSGPALVAGVVVGACAASGIDP